MLDYVEFKSGANTLRGMLHAPDGAGPHPAVMLLHGFTGNRVEANFLFVRIARRLCKAGMAVLRFDFAGSGESDGEFGEMTTSREIADAEAALDYLAGLEIIDAGRIGVTGLSLGGCVAAMLSGRRRADVKALALLAAVGDGPDTARRLEKWRLELVAAPAEGIDIGGLYLSPDFQPDLASLDPATSAGSFPGPVLVIHGDADETVPLTDAHAYRDARAGSDHPTRVEIIEGGTHVFESVAHREIICRLLTDFFGEML